MKTLRLCWRVLSDTRPFFPQLLMLLGLSLTMIPFSLLLPLPLKLIVDFALQGRGLFGIDGSSLLWIACGAEFTFLVLRGLLSQGQWLYQMRLGEKIVADARLRLFRHVQALPIRFHDRRGVADLFYRIQNDVGSMHTIAVNGLIPLVSTLLTLGTMFVVTFRIDPSLALVALGILPISWILSSTHLPKSRARWAEVKNSDQAALGVIQEVLGSMRVVRAFSQENREAQRFQRKTAEKFGRLRAAGRREALHAIFVSLLVALASATTLYLGVTHVRQGRLSLGSFLVITTYLVQLFRPLDAISRQTSSLQNALASAERYFALVAELPETLDLPGALKIGRAKGRIELTQVTFAYDREINVLRDVSFIVEPGQRVGIVGPTGSGKTTLLSLLVRFMDPVQGRLRLDGLDYRDIAADDLRRQFAIVLQEPVLFSGTIAENIAYGRPDASESQIQEAACLAEADTFIRSLPLGYQTPVGDRGMSLSGGERQRLSIARAFLMDAPILILDEPTSSLDADHEATIVASLEKLKQGRTVFTVTHRPALLKGYDVILEVEAGRVQVAKPTSENLVSHGGSEQLTGANQGA